MRSARHPIPALLAAALLLAPVVTGARDLPTRNSLPEPVVLVVRQMEGDLLQPTTGVVIGRAGDRSGVVVVPAAFVADAPADSLYVMDGGSELDRDGLPARVLRQSAEEGLALLSVDRLQRRPARVTFNAPETDHELRLAAWPTAEAMAEGSLPFWIPVGVTGKVTGQPQTLANGVDLPNITGPLIDLCGHWAGLVLADGEPALDSDRPPRVMLNDELLRVAESMEISLRLEACTQVAPIGGFQPMTSTAPPAVRQRPEPGLSLRGIFETASTNRGALVFLLAALVSGFVFWQLIKRRAETQKRRKAQRNLARETVNFSTAGLPERRTREHSTHPTTRPTEPTRPTGSDRWLRIEGSHADGRPLRAITPLSGTKFRAVIGRAGVDLNANGPGISRRHAVIEGDGARITISDLGSRNGTFVNGVRVLKDEVFHIGTNDKILLGAALVTVSFGAAKERSR